MHVYFEFELDDKSLQPKDPNNVVITTLRQFVIERYKLLNDEIGLRLSIDEIAIAVIYMRGGGAIEIKFGNVPEDLLLKLKDSISDSDMDYIRDVILYKVNDGWNPSQN